MKQADAAQASNLGQALAPAITAKFEALTQKRYEDVRLTAQLATEGIVVAGTIRPAERISVGTREQLSTLYRLCLAEYLGTTVVLDDQLVQSDVKRMDWFRALLAEKARTFQIIVFTCRPRDYVPASAMPPAKVGHRVTDGGFIRATALDRDHPTTLGAVYFPEFGFSSSIKSVTPAVLEGIADGGAASAAFLQLASGHVTHPEEIDQLRPPFSPTASAIRWPRSRCTGRWRGWFSHDGRLSRSEPRYIRPKPGFP